MLQTFLVPDQKLFGGLACLFDLLSILRPQSLLLNVIKMNFYSFRIFIGSDKFVLYSWIFHFLYMINLYSGEVTAGQEIYYEDLVCIMI